MTPGGWFWVLFDALALLVAVCGIAVVASQNIVRMAVWLMLCLSGVGGLFFLVGAEFVGAVQLLIYVGGTLVLVIFGVMLTASGPFLSIKTRAGEWVLSGLLGLTMLALIIGALIVGQDRMTGLRPAADATARDARIAQDERSAVHAETVHNDFHYAAQLRREAGKLKAETAINPSMTNQIGIALLGGRADKTSGSDVAFHNTQPAGAQGSNSVSYLFPFEIASVHLLVVLIGAAYLARARRKAESPA